MTSTLCRLIFLSTLIGLVAACATTPEQQAKRDSERCAGRGLEPNSKAHDDCISGLQSQRDARADRQHRELVERPAPVYGGR